MSLVWINDKMLHFDTINEYLGFLEDNGGDRSVTRFILAELNEIQQDYEYSIRENECIISEYHSSICEIRDFADMLLRETLKNKWDKEKITELIINIKTETDNH